MSRTVDEYNNVTNIHCVEALCIVKCEDIAEDFIFKVTRTQNPYVPFRCTCKHYMHYIQCLHSVGLYVKRFEPAAHDHRNFISEHERIDRPKKIGNALQRDT